MNWLSLLDSLLHQNLRNNADNRMLFKSRILAGVTLMYGSSMFSTMLLLLALALLDIITVWPAIISCGLSATCYFLQIIYFKKSGNHTIAAQITIAILFLFTGIFTYLTSGWESPLILFLFVIPMFAFLVSGFKSGIVWTLAVILTYSTFGIMHYYSVETPHVIAMAYVELLQYFSWMYSWMMIVGGVTIYSMIVNSLNTSLSQEKERIRLKAVYDEKSGLYTRKAFNQLLTSRIHQTLHHTSFILTYMEINPQLSLSKDKAVDVVTSLAEKMKEILSRDELDQHALLSRYSTLSVTAFIPGHENNELARSYIEKFSDELQSYLKDMDLEFYIGCVISPVRTADIQQICLDARNALHQAKQQKKRLIVNSRGDAKSANENYSSRVTLTRFDKLVQRTW